MNENTEDLEWSAQERAMRDESDSPDLAGGDSRTRSYRLIARALCERVPDALPPHFARRVAARAAVANDTPLESALIIVLVAALAICAMAFAVRFGNQWTPDAQTSGWMLAFAGCLGASWLLEKWQGRRVRYAPSA